MHAEVPVDALPHIGGRYPGRSSPNEAHRNSPGFSTHQRQQSVSSVIPMAALAVPLAVCAEIGLQTRKQRRGGLR